MLKDIFSQDLFANLDNFSITDTEPDKIQEMANKLNDFNNYCSSDKNNYQYDLKCISPKIVNLDKDEPKENINEEEVPVKKRMTKKSGTKKLQVNKSGKKNKST
jgi:hypothetical protein